MLHQLLRRPVIIRGLTGICAVYILLCLFNIGAFPRIRFGSGHSGNYILWDESIRERTLQFHQEVKITKDDLKSINSQNRGVRFNDFIEIGEGFDYVMPDIPSYRLQPREACFSDVTTLVVVVTSPMQHNIRNVIRNTWGSSRDNWPVGGDIAGSFQLIFAMGIESDPMWNEIVTMENKEKGDLLQGIDPDITLNPHVLPAFILKWGQDFCPNAQYLTYVYDDMFVHIPGLLDFLNKINRRKLFIIPKEIVADNPISTNSSVRGKYKTSPSSDVFILSSDLVSPIYLATRSVTTEVDTDAAVFSAFASGYDAFMYNTGKVTIGNSRVTGVCDVMTHRVVMMNNMTNTEMIKLWKRIGRVDPNTCD